MQGRLNRNRLMMQRLLSLSFRRPRLSSFLAACLSILSLPVSGQMQVTSGVFTPQELIENVFLANGVEVLQVNFEGSTAAIGYFNAAQTNIGIPSGIVMSTGLANTAASPNTSGSTSGQTSGGLQDPDLHSLVTPLTIQDLAAFEITFVPYADTLEFRYVFTSEEYEEYVCTQFNDVFGFFIRGNGFNGPFTGGAENIALVPGTSSYVAINTVHNSNPNQNPIVCPPQNPQFFNLTAANGQPTFDGFTDVFLAQAIVVPCDTYTIRMAIADVSDNVFDSGVFLEAKSFGTPAIQFALSTVSANETMAEGCAGGTGTFSIRAAAPAPIDIPVSFTGTATIGVDYLMNPPAITIPAGDSVLTVHFEVFEDGVTEGTESIGLIFQRNPCRLDTLWFFITDDTLPKPDLGPDLLACTGDLLSVDGTLPVIIPDPKTFVNPNRYPLISPPNSSSPLIAVYAPVQVSGVFPKNLGPGMIGSVCINIDHPWIDDVDVYLIAPSGRFIALTTDNGRDGDNYTETCFSPAATQPIDYGDPFGAPKVAAPFTGTFQPEGQWHELWDAPVNPSNGEWRLLVLDDAPLPDGELLNWRITFLPEYRLEYQWLPGAEVSCDTCSLTGTQALAAKTLYLDVRDSYGCRRSDTLEVNIHPDLLPPVPDCALIGFNELGIAWNEQGIGETFEVSINGGPWVTPNNGPAGHWLGGLGLDEPVTFVLQTTGPCQTLRDTLECRTLDCVPPALMVDQVIMPRCAGGADGSFQIVLQQGSAPATVQLNGQMVLPGFQNNLSAGTYQVYVQDTLGCDDEIMVVLVEPEALVVQAFDLDTVRCAGDADGAIAPVVTGGTGAYAWQWADGSTDSLRTGLPGGLYDLSVTDANGCQTIAQVTLYEFPPLMASMAPTDPTCSTNANGQIAVNASGGAGGYSYLWDAPGLSGPVVSGLTGGTYTVTILDANDCPQVETTTLLTPTDLMISFSSNPTTCFGGNDGEVTITVSGGMPPYGFQWSDGGPGLSMRNDLPAGMYSVTITDSDTCSTVIDIEVFEPSDIEVTPGFTRPTCNGDGDGSINVTATGGAGGYSFSWSNGVSGPLSANMFAGTYYLTTTDASGCTALDTFNLTEPLPIQTVTSPKHVTCYGGSNGIATVSASGGTGGFSFQWDDPGASMFASVPDLPAGTYRVTVTDLNGCSAVDSVAVQQPPIFTSVILSQPVSCFGATDGSGTVTPLGGIPPYTYLWNDPSGQNTPTASNLGAGTYVVTITDNNNCTHLDTLVLDEPPAIVLQVTPTQITCFGANDGKAQATVSGGTPPYTFDWSTGSKQALAQNLPPGTHQVTVTDQRGCTVVQSATIQQAPEIVITGTATAVRCSGDSDGEIDLTVVGGQAPYQFVWNNGATVEDPTGLSPGIYVVSVTDAFLCTRTFNISITSPPGMTGGLEKVDVACFGDSTGSVTSDITGGSPAYAFLWNTGATSPDLSGLPPGVYSLTVTDQNNCTITRSIEVLEPAEPLTAMMTGDSLLCFGARNGQILFEATGGTPNYRYSLDGINYNGSAIQIGLPAGTYQGYIRDKQGCEYFVGEATIVQPDQILVDLGPDIFMDIGIDTQLQALVSNGIPPYQYAWTAQDSTFLSCLDCPDPVVSGLEFTRTFRVIVTDANGCTSEAVITIHIQKVRIVLVPTAFTPNGDGQNERMGVMGRPGTVIREFQIFDRWGEQVFYADDFLIEDGLLPAHSWDGTFRGDLMNSAVFVWTLKAEFPDGETGFYKGQTTLVR